MDRPARRAVILSSNVVRYLPRGESYLSRSWFVLVVAAGGQGILDLALREPPAAAVLGFDLGDLRADEVCRRLKRSLDPPPAVVIVGPARGPDAERRCRLAGCDDFVAPPVDPRALLTRLAPHLRLHYRIHPRRRLVVPVSHGRVLREFLGYTRDLSEGGALIETALRPRPERRLLLRLYPDLEEALVLPAVVLRFQPSTHPGQNLLGVQFHGALPEARARLRDRLDRRL